MPDKEQQQQPRFKLLSSVATFRNASPEHPTFEGGMITVRLQALDSNGDALKPDKVSQRRSEIMTSDLRFKIDHATKRKEHVASVVSAAEYDADKGYISELIIKPLNLKELHQIPKVIQMNSDEFSTLATVNTMAQRMNDPTLTPSSQSVNHAQPVGKVIEADFRHRQK
jgi:hypothetical protein